MEPTRPTTVPQVVSGMVDPQIDLARIADPWEQRVTAISLVAALRGAAPPPRDLDASLPPVMSVDPFSYQLPSPDDFRRAHLPHGALLAPHEVDGWVRELALREGPPSWWFMDVWVHADEIAGDPESDGVILADGAKLRFEPTFARTRLPQPGGDIPAPTMAPRYLEYATALNSRNRVAVRAGGVLDTVRLFSLFYNHLWDWTEAQGALFVLTGLVPYAAKWAEAVAVQHGRRPRPMSLKHLELAVFTQRHGGEGLALRMARWNDLHPDWAYTSADQFSSDSARALRRMVG
jgi:hypothetical protein